MTYSPVIGPRLKSIIEQRQADVEKSKAKKSAGQLTGAIGEFAMTRGFMSRPVRDISKRPTCPVSLPTFAALRLSRSRHARASMSWI